MKIAIVLMTLVMLLTPLSSTVAGGGGNHRSTIDQNWKKVEAWQKRQSERFERIERDAARELKSVSGKTKRRTSKHPVCPY